MSAQTQTFVVEQLDGPSARRAIRSLSEILRDCVEGGASVGFLAPLPLDRAEAFWEKVIANVARGDTALFVARQGDRIEGTVQLVMGLPDNQPHRAEISKMLVHRRARRQGMAEALLLAAQANATALHKTVLTLDTATPEAARLYERLGWQAAGSVPDYAMNPDRSFCATTFYWKRLP